MHQRTTAMCVGLLGATSVPQLVAAHETSSDRVPHTFEQLWGLWFTEAVPSALVLLLGLGYTIGLMRMWRGVRIGAGIKRWEALCFAGGWCALLIALVSPLHPWGSALFAVHMTQHEILMLIAAPLMVLGRTGEAALKGLPHPLGHALARMLHAPLCLAIWSVLSNAFIAWLIHAAVLWTWHVPALFQATLSSAWVHAAQHASFFGSALLFWWAALRGDRAAGFGAAILYMFTTAMHSGLLGATIALTRSVWYPDYVRTAPDWGLTPLEDQQLGGLIMWIPAGLVYVVAGLLLMIGWMQHAQRSADTWPMHVKAVSES